MERVQCKRCRVVYRLNAGWKWAKYRCEVKGCTVSYSEDAITTADPAMVMPFCQSSLDQMEPYHGTTDQPADGR